MPQLGAFSRDCFGASSGCFFCSYFYFLIELRVLPAFYLEVVEV
jgi:hypothetical protein